MTTSTIEKIANPPATSNLIIASKGLPSIPVLRGTSLESGMSDTWLKWMQQITRTLNQLIEATKALQERIEQIEKNE